MIRLIRTLFFAGLCCAAFMAQAQYLTGGTPSAAALKGCLLLNAISQLNNGAPGSCSNLGGSPGQLAGSTWVTKVLSNGSVVNSADQPDQHWILNAGAPMPGFNLVKYHFNFAVAFVKPPVCVVSKAGPPDNAQDTLGVRALGIDSVSATGVDVNYQLPPGGIQVPVQPVRELMTLMCSIGQ